MTAPARRVAQLASIGVILAGLAWIGGFAWFLVGVGTPPNAPPVADGIVVLTGGAERIVTGARLLQQDRGRVLLISGVGHGADLGALLHGTGIDPASVAARITLGRAATSTAGNADETAGWAAGHGVQSLIVVTASYHMQRALTELARSLPGVRLIPVPVQPPALRGAGSLSRVRLLAGEYTKWLAAELGLTRLATETVREPG